MASPAQDPSESRRHTPEPLGADRGYSEGIHLEFCEDAAGFEQPLRVYRLSGNLIFACRLGSIEAMSKACLATCFRGKVMRDVQPSTDGAWS
jgi:hypothetical protein